MRLSAGIFAILLLAIMPSAADAGSLYFPRIHSDSEFETGIAITNTTTQAATIRLTLFDPSGVNVASRFFQIASRGQLLGTISDLMHPPDAFHGWLLVESPTELAGLGILAKRDTGLVTESPAITKADRGQNFAHVAIGAGWQTELAIANPSTSAVECQASLYDSSGILLASTRFVLNSKGQLLTTAETLFNIQTSLSGHIEISAATPIAATETFRTVYGLATVAGQGGVPQSTGNVFTAYLPHVRAGSSEWTGIAYANPSADPTVVDVRILDDAGNLVSFARAVLPAKAQRVSLVSDLAPNWAGTGYITLSANLPIVCLQLNGSGNPASSSFSGWAAITEVGAELYIPHVAQGSGWNYLVSILNTSSIANDLAIRVLNSSGSITASVALHLAPGEQISRLLSDVVPIDNQLSGSIDILATSSFIGTATFTDSNGQVSIPFVRPLDYYARGGSGLLLSTLRVGSAGATLQAPPEITGDPFGNFKLVIPPGALTADTDISVYLGPPNLPAGDPAYQLVQFPFRFFPAGTTFAKPVKFTFPIPNEILKAYSASINTVQLLTYDDVQRLWLPVTIVERNAALGTLTAELTHFSDYAPQINQQRSQRDPTADVKTIFDVSGYGADIIDGANKLLQTDTFAQSSKFGLAAEAAAASMEVVDDLNSGNFILAAATASSFIGETAGQFACEKILGDSPVGYICDEAVAGVFYVAEKFGVKFGAYIGDVAASANIRNYQKQMNRYMYWLEQLNTAFSDMQRCSGHWLQDPISKQCNAQDKDLPFFLENDPFAGCVMNFPCGFANPYTLEGLDKEAQGLLAKARNEARMKAEALRKAVVQEFLDRMQAIRVASYPSSLFTVNPSLSGIAPFEVSLDGTLSSPGAFPITSFVWDFGDGQGSGATKAKHTYRTPGTFPIHLMVTDSSGITVSNTRFVTVSRGPDSAISAASPAIVLDSNAVTTPASIAVTGTGFPPGELVTITWTDSHGQHQSSPQSRTSIGGSFTFSISFSAMSAVGDYTVTAISFPSATTAPDARIHVTSSLPPPIVDSINPSTQSVSGNAATSFNLGVTGRNFVSGTFAKVFYASNATYGGIARRTGDLTGTIPASVIQSSSIALYVPLTLTSGDYDVEAVNPDGQESNTKRLVVAVDPSQTPGSFSGGPSSGQQLTTTFSYSGSGLTPNGTIQQWFQGPSGTSSAAIQANASGQVSWTYVYKCTDTPGTWNTWIVDSVKGYTSVHVVNTVSANPSCAAGSFSGSPSSGQQLTTTFSYSGSGLTPNGTIQQWSQGPSGTSSATIQANASGQVSWTYVYKCTDTPGSWNTWIVDSAKGYTSAKVVNTISANPSCATSTFTGSPSSGQQLTTTFSYSGSGLTPNGTIQQWFQGPSGTSSATIQANASGQVSWTYVYKCTDTPGSWNTWIVDSAKGYTSAKVVNTISANPSCATSTFTGSPSSGQQLTTTFSYSGSGLTPNGTIQQWFQGPSGTSSATIQANASGQVSWTYVYKCTDTPGSWNTWIVDSVKGYTSVQVSNVVSANPSCAAATFSVSPSSGQQLTTTFTYTATGLTPNGNIQQWFQDPNGGLQNFTVQANSSGNLSWQYIFKCTDPPGTHQNWIIDTAKGYTSQKLPTSVSANPSCTPGSFSGGPSSGQQLTTTFSYSGSGLTPNGTIQQWFQGPSGTSSATIQANASGNVSWTYVYKCTDTPGTWNTWIVDSVKGYTSTKVSNVVSANPSCAAGSFSGSPSSGQQLTTTFSYSGSGLTPNGTIQQWFQGPSGTSSATIQANASGNVSWTYVYKCTDTPGTWNTWIVDSVKGYTSVQVSNVVSANPSCTPGSFSGGPSSGQQLTTTFSYSGSGLTPNGTIQQWFQGPSGTSSATIQANASGQVSWTYVYKCTDTPGTWNTWIVDSVKGYTSVHVVNTVSANPSCTPGSFSGGPSSGQQLTTTFSYSGLGLTPNGTIQQWFQGPSGTSSATIQANASGQVSWTYVYKCTDTPGTWNTWIVDSVKGYTSVQVSNVVSANPSCTPGSFSGGPSSGQQLTTTFSYSGSGLTPNGTIQQWFQGPSGTSSATIQANASGQVSWTYVYKCTDTPGTWNTWIVDSVKGYTSVHVVNTVSANPSCTPGSFSGGPSSGQQLTTTFSYSGSGLTPNGTIQQWFQGPSGTSSATIQANASGQVSWTYVYKCTDTPGTWNTWIVDSVKGYTSVHVVNTVSANPSCTPGSFSGGPSSGQQLTTTFSYSGSGLTPNGTIQQWFQGPSGTSSATIQANASGNVSWTYVYKCTDTPGTWNTWIVDSVKGYTSVHVVNTVSKHPSCP